MSYKRVLRTLASLGLSRSEAEVYIRLAADGPMKAKNLAYALSLQRHALDEILRSLRTKRVVNFNPKKLSLFSAVPFEQALVQLLKQRLSEAQTVELNKTKLLARWQKMLQESNDNRMRIDGERVNPKLP